MVVVVVVVKLQDGDGMVVLVQMMNQEESGPDWKLRIIASQKKSVSASRSIAVLFIGPSIPKKLTCSLPSILPVAFGFFAFRSPAGAAP